MNGMHMWVFVVLSALALLAIFSSMLTPTEN